MNQSRAYGNIEVYCPEGNLMFRANEDKLRFYKKNNLVDKIHDSAYKLKFKPAGLGHTDRNKDLLEPRENKCVRCGEVDILLLTRHHVVPTRFRKYFPENLKSNNHRYVVFLCRDCHDEYGYFENDLNNELSAELGLKTLRECINEINVEKRIITGIADTILFKEGIPAERLEELKRTFKSRSGLEPTTDNLMKVRKRKYEPIEDHNNFGKMVVEKTKNLYAFQQRWLEHFVETMEPKHLPNDLKVLLEHL
jgi:hypothetical protein